MALTTRPGLSPALPFAPDSALDLPGQSNEPNTCTLAVTATSGRVPISLNGAFQIELYNSGNADCFVTFGDVTIVATVPSTSTGCYPVGPGQVKIITVVNPNVITNMAAICAGTNTTTLFASPGVGAS